MQRFVFRERGSELSKKGDEDVPVSPDQAEGRGGTLSAGGRSGAAGDDFGRDRELERFKAELRLVGIILTVPCARAMVCIGVIVAHDDGGVIEVVPRRGLDREQVWRLLRTAQQVWVDLGVARGDGEQRFPRRRGWVYVGQLGAHVLGVP